MKLYKQLEIFKGITQTIIVLITNTLTTFMII